MKHKVEKLFADCFIHLGQKALYQSKHKKQSVQILSKRPDRFYGIGEGQFVGEMLFLEVSVFEVLQPTVGDIFIIGSCKYKIHLPPLRDNSSMLWKIECIVIGEKDA